MTRRSPARLLRDSQGATIVEFALVAPTLIMLLMGVLDLAYNMYTNQQLQGAIQQAARGSSIEGASSKQASVDAIVTNAVQTVARGATVSFTRESYTNFSNVSRGENFTDLNHDGTCDAGEPFEDTNGNGVWDRDSGTAGFGGARDAVLYTVTVTYPRAFPLGAFIPGLPRTVTMSAATVLRNQPFAQQTVNTATTGNCP